MIFQNIDYICIVKAMKQWQKPKQMTTTLTTNEQIQKVKTFICRWAFNSGMYRTFEMMSDSAENIISQVAIQQLGFASEIASTVEKSKRVSEKQAYWIAKAAVEKNLIVDADFIFED